MGWKLLGCYTDDPRISGAHTLKFPKTGAVEEKKLNMTIEYCQEECHTSNHVFAGVEYGRECCKFLAIASRRFGSSLYLQIAMM